MLVKIFTQAQCSNCPPAKELGKKLEREGVKIDWQDTSTIDGLTEAQFYSVLSTPTIVITDDEGGEIKSWRGETPAIKEIKKFLK